MATPSPVITIGCVIRIGAGACGSTAGSNVARGACNAGDFFASHLGLGSPLVNLLQLVIVQEMLSKAGNPSPSHIHEWHQKVLLIETGKIIANKVLAFDNFDAAISVYIFSERVRRGSKIAPRMEG